MISANCNISKTETILPDFTRLPAISNLPYCLKVVCNCSASPDSLLAGLPNMQLGMRSASHSDKVHSSVCPLGSFEALQRLPRSEQECLANFSKIMFLRNDLECPAVVHPPAGRTGPCQAVLARNTAPSAAAVTLRYAMVLETLSPRPAGLRKP